MTDKKLYATRSLRDLDKLGNFYCKHLMAMTAEDLHKKSDIAAELAHRDYVIQKLLEVVKECDDYLDINNLTSIGSGSILHRGLKEVRELGEAQ